MSDATPSETEFQIDREALIQAFHAESGEVLAAMEQLILALETRPEDDETLHSLFRAAHTLKGSSSLVAFDAVRDLAHTLEGLLEKLRSKVLRANGPIVSLLLRALDVFRLAIAHAMAEKDAPLEVQRLQAELRAATETGLSSGPAAPPLSAAPAGTAISPSPSSPPARTLRVDVGKLDRMLNLSGEIAISRGRMTDMLERRTSLTVDEILEAHREADRLYLDLQDLIMKARMVPIAPTFQQHVRTVRDLSSAQKKQVHLLLEGEEVEVDTSVVEHIRDPLTHMIRNAVDHGIETPEARQAKGKDPVGSVTLKAFHEGAFVVIQVLDDGGGLDRERILKKAVKLGLVSEGAQPRDEEVFGFIFAPGFSTAEKVTDVSGRGVGMDVVRRNVEAMRGSVTVASELGHGTTVTMRFPLTLAIIQGFRVIVAGEVFILPLDVVAECVELPPGQGPGRQGLIDLRGRPLPYLRLRDHFGLHGSPPARESIVVVRHAGSLVGLAVDALLGESQTVIKPLSRVFQGLKGMAGSSILGDGRVALILDVASLLREMLSSNARLRVDTTQANPCTQEAPAAHD